MVKFELIPCPPQSNFPFCPSSFIHTTFAQQTTVHRHRHRQCICNDLTAHTEAFSCPPRYPACHGSTSAKQKHTTARLIIAHKKPQNNTQHTRTALHPCRVHPDEIREGLVSKKPSLTLASAPNEALALLRSSLSLYLVLYSLSPPLHARLVVLFLNNTRAGECFAIPLLSCNAGLGVCPSDREPPGADVVHEDASLDATVQGQEHLRGGRAARAAKMVDGTKLHGMCIACMRVVIMSYFYIHKYLRESVTMERHNAPMTSPWQQQWSKTKARDQKV